MYARRASRSLRLNSPYGPEDGRHYGTRAVFRIPLRPSLCISPQLRQRWRRDSLSARSEPSLGFPVGSRPILKCTSCSNHSQKGHIRSHSGVERSPTRGYRDCLAQLDHQRQPDRGPVSPAHNLRLNSNKPQMHGPVA
jgi:hypothetical protein